MICMLLFTPCFPTWDSAEPLSGEGLKPSDTSASPPHSLPGWGGGKGRAVQTATTITVRELREQLPGIKYLFHISGWKYIINRNWQEVPWSITQCLFQTPWHLNAKWCSICVLKHRSRLFYFLCFLFWLGWGRFWILNVWRIIRQHADILNTSYRSIHPLKLSLKSSGILLEKTLIGNMLQKPRVDLNFLARGWI